MNLCFYQLKQAYLSLKQKPGFVFSVVSTIGITLGALLCVMTLAYVMLVKPLPYSDQDKLMRVDHALINEKGINNLTAFTYPSLIHLYENQQVFERSALINYQNDIITSLADQPKMNTAYVTPEWFPLFDSAFILGRGFGQSEAINTHNPVAILSYDKWINEYDSDKNILDKSVMLRGISFRIIGVLNRSFIEPAIQQVGKETGIWLPWDFNENAFLSKRWGNIRPNLVFVGKLKNGLSNKQAEQSVTPLVNGVWRENVASIQFFKGWNIKMKVRSFNEVIIGESKKTTYYLLIAIFGLVIIACANIANLFMSRAAAQQHHLAVQAILGAKRSHLYRYFLFEAMLLMAISLVIAVIVAFVGFGLIRENLSTMLPRTEELAINGATIFTGIFFMLLLSLLFARISSRTKNNCSINRILQSSNKGSGRQVSHFIRSLFITLQVTAAAIIVFVSLSLFKSSVAAINTPLGFELANISQFSLANSNATSASNEEKTVLMTEVINKLALLPAVKSVSKSSSPFIKSGEAVFTTLDTNEALVNENRYVDNAYFQMINQPLLEGRYFDAEDVKDQNKVLIINDVLAKQLAPKSTALGMKLKSPRGKVCTIIGVVKGIKLPGANTIPMRTYRPEPLSFTRALIKTHENQELTRSQIIRVLEQVSTSWSLFNFEYLDNTHNRLLFIPIATAITTSVVALLAIFLSGIGLFGILSYSTQLRRFEIGTHMAIGAKGKDIIALVFKENAGALIMGIVASFFIMLGLYLSFSETLASYISLDLLPIFIITLALISSLSFFACYLPLRQYINKAAIHSLRGEG